MTARKADRPYSRTMRTLIYHDGALGDVLLSLPCMKAIGEGGDELHFVGRPDAGRLLTELAVVGGCASSDKGMFAHLFACGAGEDARAFLGLFDRAFVFTVKQNPALMKNIGRSVPDARTIITLPPAGLRAHAADFRMMQFVGTAQDADLFGFDIPPAARERARQSLVRAGYNGRGTAIAIHPGSGGKRKCWPLERYFEAAERLTTGADAFLLFLSGPAEGPAMRERIGHFIRDRERIAHLAELDLVTVAGLLSRCGLYLGNDSGISHLAAAVRCPVIALFGPTDPALWSPRGPAVRVIASEALDTITVERVMGIADELLNRKSPFDGAL